MRKFPYYKQLDAMDCGPTCLRMLAKYYGKSYSLQYLRNHSYITREGVSMLGISEAAENIGYRTKGYRLTWEVLSDDVPMPCIIHWKQRHFVVVYAIKKTKSSLSFTSPLGGATVYPHLFLILYPR
jgi:ATP-binding cassette, subfamily B, bacterial